MGYHSLGRNTVMSLLISNRVSFLTPFYGVRNGYSSLMVKESVNVPSSVK
jgi:hypothetical protein